MSSLDSRIQVNTAKMIYAKENYSIAYKLLGGKTMREIYKETKKPSGWGHALYEQSRTAKSNGGKKQRSVSMQQAYNQSRAKKYGFQKQYEKCTTALAMMGMFFPHEEGQYYPSFEYIP